MGTINSWNNAVAAAKSDITLNAGTNTISIGSDASANSVNIATGAASKVVTLGSTNTTSSLALKYGTADFTLASTTGTVMSALDTGECTYPFQPAFSAALPSEVLNVTGNGGFYVLGTTGGIALTEIFDQNSDFNTNGTFTAPVSGRYFLSTTIWVTGMSSAMTSGTIQILTSNRAYFFLYNPYVNADAAGNSSRDLNILADMDAGDTAYVRYIITGGAGDTADIHGEAVGAFSSWFCGYLVC